MLIKTLIASAIKILSAFSTFALTFSVARIFDAKDAGLFLLSLALLGVASIFFRLGLDNVVLKEISAKNGTDNSQSVLLIGIRWVALACVLATIFTFIFSEYIATQILTKPEFSSILQVSILALPAMAIFMLISMGFQAFHRVVITTLLQNLGISCLFLIGLFAAWLLYSHELTIMVAVKIYVASAFLILIVAIFMWNMQIKGDWGKAEFKDKRLWQASSNLWAATSMSLTVQWAGFLIAGIYVSSTDIAYLSAASRTANLVSFVLVVVNMVVAPRYAKLWHEGQKSNVQYLAKQSTRIMLALVIPVVLIIIIFAKPIMGIFGMEYIEGATLLIIMAVGQFINVATGSVGFLLNMSGHERDFRRVTFFAGPLTIFLSWILIQYYGVLGAAIGTAVGMSVQNIGALYMVRKRLGFWPIG